MKITMLVKFSLLLDMCQVPLYMNSFYPCNNPVMSILIIVLILGKMTLISD